MPWEKNRNLALSHALRAAETHDDVVGHFTRDSRASFIWEDVSPGHEPGDNLNDLLIEGTLSDGERSAIGATADAWNEEVELRLATIPRHDAEAFRAQVYRRFAVRRVK
jgi:hypothetical protein